MQLGFPENNSSHPHTPPKKNIYPYTFIDVNNLIMVRWLGIWVVSDVRWNRIAVIPGEPSVEMIVSIYIYQIICFYVCWVLQDYAG